MPPLHPGLPCGRACPRRSPHHWGLLGSAGGLEKAQDETPRRPPCRPRLPAGPPLLPSSFCRVKWPVPTYAQSLCGIPPWPVGVALCPLLACPAGSVGGLCLLGLNPGFTPNCRAELDRRWPWDCLAVLGLVSWLRRTEAQRRLGSRVA